MRFKNFFKRKNIITIAEKKNLKMSIDISRDYLNRVYKVISGEDKRNSIGGMLRGSTLHLRNFEDKIKEKESQGVNMDKYKELAKNVRIDLNDEFLRAKLKEENSPYEKELIKEGFLNKI